MLLIFLNWIYIFFISLGMGSWLQSIIVPKQKNLFFTVLIGLFAELLLIHFSSLLLPINLLFYIFNSLLSICGLFLHRKEFILLFYQLKNNLKTWSFFTKIVGIFLGILVLMQSASIPYIPDNESYYLQSIKWLNEYGLVKGLANLHLFYGQMSGWHLLQSGFNFGFISNSFNDLNGFLMFICSLFFLQHLDSYFKLKKYEDLFLGLIPIGNLFFFQFVNTPSPDLPLFLISQIIFYLFYRNFKIYQNEYRLILCLCVFLILIKITIVPLLTLPFILLIRHKKITKEFAFTSFLGLTSLLALTLKNYIISGYLAYPMNLFGAYFNPDWKLPENLLGFYYHYTKMSAFTQIDALTTEGYDYWQLFKLWLFEPKLRTLFNSLIVALLVIFPFFIRKNRAVFWLYIYALFQFLVLFFSSPQYRFFIPLIIGLGIYLLVLIIQKQTRLVKSIIIFFYFLPLIPLFVSINIQSLTNNDFMPPVLQALEWKNVYEPNKNSRFHYQFKKVKTGNLIYNSPTDKNSFFWISSDGELPCVNQQMIDYFQQYYHTQPQLRTGNLKDGFYSKNLTK